MVDDIVANTQLLEAWLRAEYFEVASASAGPAALRLAEGWKPDVILLDVMMPGMDGYEVCRRLKACEETRHTPVVMVTALVDQAERVRGLEAGADDFLSKPVDHAMLFARLRALLRTKQTLDAFRVRAETARDLGLHAPEAPIDGLPGARVLVAATDPQEAAQFEAMLVTDGVIATCATSEAEVWDLAVRGDFDAAVLGLCLGDGDGLRLTSRLRAHSATRELPVLLVADPEQHAQVLRGLDIGASDYVVRPVDPNELRARLRNQVRRKHYGQRLRDDMQRSLKLAFTDELTGLRNRHYSTSHLRALLRESGATVLMIDVDHFKAINDTHGHPVGDLVLRELADRLRDTVRSADVVARYGGEEFLVIMPGSVAADVEAVAERLRQAVGNTPFVLRGAGLMVTVSIGCASARAGTAPGQLIDRADAALYRAKAAGRNRLEVA